MGVPGSPVSRCALVATWIVCTLAASGCSAAVTPHPRAVAGVAAGLPWLAHRPPGEPTWYSVSTSSYALSLSTGSPWLLVKGAGGAGLRLPLSALIGRPRLPRGSSWAVAAAGGLASVATRAADGRHAVVVRVTAASSYFTISIEGELGRALSAQPVFFSTGPRAIDMSKVTGGFTPDPVFASSTRTPVVKLGPIAASPYTAPFAPPPFDVELAFAGGWLGLGLEQVPDATRLGVSPGGRVTINYPLGILSRVRDRGPGGTAPPPHRALRGTWLRFPTFLMTVAPSSRAGLLAYHDALAALGAATTAAPPGHRPSWWSWPLVDTWGQQLVTDAARKDEEFTGAWVRRYVAIWKSRFHLQHFTVIIDSQWQGTLGSAIPSSRFDGVAGMQRLVRDLHAEGIKVLLWWPLWVLPGNSVSQVRADPSSAAFAAALAGRIRTAVGSGPSDLHADGLKLDWSSLIPGDSNYSRPQLGVGAAGLLRYMRLIAGDAWGAKPSAVIDASAMAPQFVRYEDLLRLYDANSSEAWSDRAATVSAVDPNTLMDGDGWRLTGSQAVSHIVGSAVFGTPALYYASRWGGGAPISVAEAGALGALIGLTQTRGQGVAAPLNRDPVTGDDWKYEVGGRLAAETLAGARAVVVYRYRGACASPYLAEVVSTGAGPVTVPMPVGTRLLGARPQAPAATGPSGSAVILDAGAGVEYTLSLLPPRC